MNIKFLSMAFIFLTIFSISNAMNRDLHLDKQSAIFWVEYALKLKQIDPNEILLRGIKEQKADLVKLALTYGADVNFNQISRVDRDCTSLYIALDYKNLDIIQILLNAGADLTIKGGFYNDDILELAKGLVDTYRDTKIQDKYIKVLELLQDWQKKLKQEVKKEMDPYLLPVLGDIVADYVV